LVLNKAIDNSRLGFVDWEKIMNVTLAVATLMVMMIGAQSALACSRRPPEESKMVGELQTVGLAHISSDPSKINIIIKPLQDSYQVGETNSTGMCPDEVHFTGQYSVRYEVVNGLATTCNVWITVTKNVPWSSDPKVTYEVENAHLASYTK
jgi:hypothetical protein